MIHETTPACYCPPKTGGGNREFSYDIGIRAEVASTTLNFFKIFATVAEYALVMRLLFPVAKQFCAMQRNRALCYEQTNGAMCAKSRNYCDPKNKKGRSKAALFSNRAQKRGLFC
ncbi:hypothetical protein [Paraburkholderia sp. J67]|uniref:hypothetical protein n=1 Tax=Paraburkholderia sp. J67 TaxID=2805435 RepID=UPI002ABD5E31|nr:hypothetical protein [Paraburkholderia sp. J67]